MEIIFYILIIILILSISPLIKSLFSPSKSNNISDNVSKTKKDIEVNDLSEKKTLSKKIENKDSTPSVKNDVETVIAGAILYDAFSGDDESNEFDSDSFKDSSSSFEDDNDDSNDKEIDIDDEEDDFDFLF